MAVVSSEERLGRVEGILEEVRTRLNQLENRVENRFGLLENRFNLLLVLLITMWVTLMGTILSLGLIR